MTSAGVRAAVERDVCGHAGLDVARIGLGDLELDLEGGEVDHRDERRALGDARFLGLREVRDHAIHGRAHGELVDAALQVLHDELLAIALEALRAQLEREAVALEVAVALAWS